MPLEKWTWNKCLLCEEWRTMQHKYVVTNSLRHIGTMHAIHLCGRVDAKYNLLVLLPRPPASNSFH